MAETLDDSSHPRNAGEALAWGWAEAGRIADYDELGLLLDRVGKLAAQYNDVADFAILRGSIHQKRAEFYAASELQTREAQRFPARNDVLYEAALNSVDAGLYARAQAQLRQLASRIDQLTDRQLRGLWRGACMVGLHDVAEAAHRSTTERGSELATHHVAERIQAMGRIQAAIRGQDLAVISVGENCYPWVVFNRWGFRDRPDRTDAEMIFNLAQCSTDGCTAILQDKTDRLIDESVLTVAMKPNSYPMPANSAFGLEFNHEQGIHWTSGNFVKLRERYAARLAAFRTGLRARQRLFVHYTERNGDLDAFAEAIDEINPDRNYRVLIVDVWRGRTAQLRNSAQVDHLRIDLPHPNYVWFRPDDLDSPEGVAFERAAVDRALGLVGELGVQISI